MQLAKAVMVISSQNSLRQSAESLLDDGGYIVCPGVETVGGFPHALNASETMPNVILVDYWLSRAATGDFLKSLKRQGFAVILMGTAFLGKDLATTERVGFLEKPFTKNQLLKAVADVKR